MNLPTPGTCILIIHWSIVAGLSLRVIARRPPVGVAMAWLAVIAATPFVGATVYLLFGEKRLGRGRAAAIARNAIILSTWQNQLRQEYGEVAKQIESSALPISNHAHKALGSPALNGNEIELLDNFQAVFDKLVSDIDAAQTKCHLCFYIWHEGGRCIDVIEALIRAAKRGVHCKALADAVGSKSFLCGDLARRLRKAGVELSASLPTGPVRTLFVRRDLRNHRKIVAIDDHIAFTGSQNLVDPRYFKKDSNVGEWIDAIVRITGPTAAALDTVFELDWSVETGQACELPQLKKNVSSSTGGEIIQVVPSGPALQPQAIHQLLLTAIYAARRSLVMTTPYFVPDESILTALTSAALRGVEVTLIVPARNDSLMVRFASVAHFDDLMTAGVKIARFEGGLLHTKSLTVDGKISMFGSVNLDMRSLWLNFEISLFVYGNEFTSKLENLQKHYLENCNWIHLEEWNERPRWHRFAENTFRLIGPLL